MARTGVVKSVAVIACLLLIGLWTSACDTTIGIELIDRGGQLPEFQLTGNEPVDFIWVRGPVSTDETLGAPPIVWHISGPASNPPPSQIPTIKFGILPPGWEQNTPKEGKPTLSDNAMYRVTVVTTRNRSSSLLFRIENGKISQQSEKTRQ